jgi:hypothetical protein
MSKCQISCGDCCDQWAYVDALWRKHRRHHRRDDPCPHQGTGGCELLRRRRPKVCQEFLCVRARSRD